ncbi:FadR/GntR family transcriptional regulator, partial [Pseudonocardia pini]|uniref:FadR/GntR family transcriptional regulator n=1 Tax=Pseudonocardia pini TaxID=2758030 RepID=UPI0015F04945
MASPSRELPSPAPPTGSWDKLASGIARAIEDDVVAKGWPAGESLGSEPELRERFGVSRTVLREAVRLLEHRRVARMRRGPGGGLIVVVPDSTPALRALLTYFEYEGTSMADLFQARRALEPLAAELAAARIDETGVVDLRALVTAEPHVAAGEDGWTRDPLHLAIGRLAGNPVLELFLNVLDKLTHRYVRAPWRAPDPELLLTVKDEAHRAHLSIVEAVVSGDAPSARVQMTAHLVEAMALLDGAPDHHTTRRVAPLRRDNPAGSGASLAEEAAGHIYDDITRSGWPVGEVLGAEPELMRRYDVSRAVLRAAIRLLEHHGVARSRRGPNGGLVVTRP